MKMFALIVASLVAATTVTAATEEQVASAAGQAFIGYDRAKLLCSIEGISMPSFQETYPPDMVDLVSDMKKRYPEAFEIGARKGYAQAEHILADKRDYTVACERYRKRFQQ